LALVCAVPPAMAQEATNTPAATQPAVGKLYLRERLQYVRFGYDPSPEQREVDKFLAITTLTYGLARDLSASVEVPFEYEAVEHPDRSTDREAGVGDVLLQLKYRPLQIDLNPLDSVRLAIYGGVEVPSGDGDFSSHSFDPMLGAVFTAILGRHGFNQSVSYKFNTGGDEFGTRPGDGPDDALRYDTAYLFRLHPEAYGPETGAAVYLTCELNGLYETNGDNEVLLGPGLLYEARTFALEASVGLPIVQDVDERPRTEMMVTLGFRILF
jgi:hypothetical protein